MKSARSAIFMFLLMGIVILLQQSLFIVQQTQQALVIQLGHPLDKVYRPGLHKIGRASCRERVFV